MSVGKSVYKHVDIPVDNLIRLHHVHVCEEQTKSSEGFASRLIHITGGVKIVLPFQGAGISEILFKEQGSMVTAKVAVKDLVLSHLCWFDWSTGIGFPPVAGRQRHTLAKAPLLGAVAGVFADLVTGQEGEIGKRTVIGESAVLLPGDGTVKIRMVYSARGEDSLGSDCRLTGRRQRLNGPFEKGGEGGGAG